MDSSRTAGAGARFAVGLGGVGEIFDSCRTALLQYGTDRVRCLVLLPLSLAMDPKYGVKCLRGKTLEEKWKAQYEKDAKVVLKEALKDVLSNQVVTKDTDKTADEAVQAAYDAVSWGPRGSADSDEDKKNEAVLRQRKEAPLLEALKTAGVEQLESPGRSTLIQKCEAALRKRKVDAVWRWADTVEDGALQKEELERIAEALGSDYDLDRVCRELGVEVPTTAGEISVTRKQFKEEKGKLVADEWFEKLCLPLLPVEAGCLDFFCAC